jgi:serine/threonine-protein kinase
MIPAVGSRMSHYALLELLGEGGMGAVWRARDETLGRDVAIKVLRSDALRDTDARRRFAREASLVSRLSHPHVGIVHHFEQHDGVDYLVMELVEGGSLARRIGAGPLAEPEAVRLALQIAEALDAAHQLGLVHRDLKPANILLTARGDAKVIDFGIARWRGTDSTHTGDSLRTAERAPAGTLAYMAPEQLLAAELDGRADLYALGVILYEMTTGKLPFDAPTPAVLAGQIIHAPPPPPRRVRPDLSPALDGIILRLLSKRPEARHPSASALAIDLRRLAGGREGDGARIRSVAVLPLENLSGDPAQEFFADGMTDALISNLARTESLRVISRTSAMQYKGRRKPLPEIARELAVDAVLEGAVLRVGDRVRVSVQLIDAPEDRHLWAGSYERDLGDVLALQAEIASAVVGEVRTQLTPNEQERLARRPRVNPEAHLAYLKGRHQWNRRTPEALRAAVGFFEQALAFDASHAPAYAGLADAYSMLADNHAIAPREAARRAREAARAAIALDDTLPEAYTSLAYTSFFFEWDFAGAGREFERSIRLNPNVATTHQWYSIYLAAMGRAEESYLEADRALELDPLSMIIYTSAGDARFFARRFAEAASYYLKALELEPDFVPAVTDLARAYELAGDYERSIAAYQRALAMRGADARGAVGLAHAYALSGRRDEALAIAHKVEEDAKTEYRSSYGIGSLWTALGEVDRAMAWLEKAFLEADTGMVWLKVHPRLDRLHGHPPFEALVERMRYPAAP